MSAPAPSIAQSASQSPTSWSMYPHVNDIDAEFSWSLVLLTCPSQESILPSEKLCARSVYPQFRLLETSAS
jgi:hypothetical protein